MGNTILYRLGVPLNDIEITNAVQFPFMHNVIFIMKC